MSEVIYTLCALTSLLSAWLLLRSYVRTRFRLLFWSGLCFAGLAVTNILLALEKLAFHELDLAIPRLAVTLVALSLLLFGLIYEEA